jgi:hypothetical protein
LAEKESKLEVLQQLNEEGEGFAAGTQTVLRGLDNPEFFKPSILGALASQIEVEQQFISAIEAASRAEFAGDHHEGFHGRGSRHQNTVVEKARSRFPCIARRGNEKSCLR